jgi:hypothetical protein
MTNVWFSTVLGALCLTACSGAIDPDDTLLASAADTTAPSPPPLAARECLIPTGASPGITEIWELGASKLERTTVFFWRGVVRPLDSSTPAPPTVTWAVDRTEDDAKTLRYTGTESVADGSVGRTVDAVLKRDAERPWIDLAGTITLSKPGQADEVIAIRYGKDCRF